MNTLPTPEQLAVTFTACLAEALDDIKLRRIRLRNAVERDRSTCHSHDECDANEIMARALARNGLGEDAFHEHLHLVNEAWRIAKDLWKHPDAFDKARISELQRIHAKALETLADTLPFLDHCCECRDGFTCSSCLLSESIRAQVAVAQPEDEPTYV